MRNYNAKIMLEGACYDAIRLLKDGDTKRAYGILYNKILEIRKIDESGWGNVEW
jgi:hypothetical protein